MSNRLSRRDFSMASGLALGGVSLAGAVAGAGSGTTPTTWQCDDNACGYPVKPKTTQQYSYPNRLRKFTPDMRPDLAADEMRITNRRVQPNSMTAPTMPSAWMRSSAS